MNEDTNIEAPETPETRNDEPFHALLIGPHALFRLEGGSWGVGASGSHDLAEWTPFASLKEAVCELYRRALIEKRPELYCLLEVAFAHVDASRRMEGVWQQIRMQ